jgi:hypothetical protein
VALLAGLGASPNYDDNRTLAEVKAIERGGDDCRPRTGIKGRPEGPVGSTSPAQRLGDRNGLGLLAACGFWSSPLSGQAL